MQVYRDVTNSSKNCDREMDEVLVKNSRWAQFAVDKPIGKLNVHAVQLWNEMKIEFMTHYQGRDAKVHVYIKSNISHRKSKWTHFLISILGHSLKLVKYGKYRTPLDSMKGTPFYDELTNNRFTIDMNDSMPVAADIEPPPAPNAEPPKRNRGRTVLVTRVFNLDVADGQILPKAGDQSGYMFRAMRLFFGESLGRDHYKELQALSLLETHRRVLRLEQFLADKDVPLADTAAQRARAFGPGKYIVVDPVTLCIPLLLGYLRGSFNMQDTAGFRCRAVLASIHALTAYGLELSRLIREHLSAPLQAEAEPYLVEWPFPFIPDGMRSTLSAGLTGIDPGQIVARRIEKEQDDYREAVRTKRVPGISPVIAFHARMVAAAGALLSSDTAARNYTRHLPPTPSMPDAVYDPAAFLAQLPPPGSA